MTFKTAINFLFLPVALLFLTASPADAHIIGGSGFSSGISHPFLGLDHLLAMIAVGIIGIQIGGKAKWLVPLSFVIFMTYGVILAISGIQIPSIGTGIALSLLVFGVTIAMSKKYPLIFAVACTGLFALFHGHTHGTEMTSVTSPILFISGMIISTTLLHLTGLFIGNYAKKTAITSKLLRYSGALISLFGLLLGLNLLTL